jgi:hypothetical protein
MGNITKSLQWLQKQIKNDDSQILNHKNKTIQKIKKELPVFDKQKLNMPQFSERYLKEKAEENKPKIMEGYLASLLNLSDNLPFQPTKAEMNFTLTTNTYVKVLKEVERIKLGEEAEIIDIPPYFDVEINEIKVTFTLEDND